MSVVPTTHFSMVYIFLWVESRRKTQSCVDRKSSFSHLDSSSKQWWIGANWPLLASLIHVLSYVFTQSYIFHLTFWSSSDVSYSDECQKRKAFSMSKNVTAFSCCSECVNVFQYL